MAESLKAVARQYWLEGCNIILLRGKEPLHKWQRWQTERQNELAFEALPWNEADSFAVICGQQLHNELYIGAIDYDVKNLPSDVVEKGREVLKHLPITLIEQTPSGGQHWIYLSHTKSKSVNAYHNICGLELLGEGKLCIMAPSTGYRRLNDNSPTIVQDLEAIFYEALEKAGIRTEKPARVWFDNEELAKQPYRGRDPPCIQALLRGTSEGLRNEYGIRLASYFINFKQYSPKTVREDILKSWNKLNNPELPSRELDAIVKSAVQGKYVYGCTDPILKSQCNSEKCPLAPKNAVKLLTPEERERAEKLLVDPKLLDYVVKFGRRRLIGEDNVLLTNFIILCSGQT
ncbi:MAG: bifunctional DNA primase/polymerase, partial [Candidatus Bathyarchaeia archaeon]